MKKEVTLLFDRETDLLFCTLDKVVDVESDRFYGKNVILDNEKETWVGTFTEGQVMLKDDVLPMILETSLNKKCSDNICSAYPIKQQIRIISEQLDHISDSFTDDYRDMRTYIRETLSINKNYKNAIRNSPRFEYETSRESLNKYNKSFKGGRFEKNGKHDIDKPFFIEDYKTNEEI